MKYDQYIVLTGNIIFALSACGEDLEAESSRYMAVRSEVKLNMTWAYTLRLKLLTFLLKNKNNHVFIFDINSRHRFDMDFLKRFVDNSSTA